MKIHDARCPMRTFIAARLSGAGCKSGGPGGCVSTPRIFSGTITSLSVPDAVPGIDLGAVIQGSPGCRFPGCAIQGQDGERAGAGCPRADGLHLKQG